MGDQGAQSGSSVILSEATSLLLEFTRLWQATGNRTYFDSVQRVTDWFDRNLTANYFYARVLILFEYLMEKSLDRSGSPAAKPRPPLP